MRKLSVLAILGLICAGCGDGGPAKAVLHPVSGKVTVGGKPLADCKIQFVMTGKEGAYTSPIAADGSYSLVSPDGRSGAEAGKYKVVLMMSQDLQMKTMYSGGGGGPPKPGQGAPYPQEYSSLETSPKEVTVEAKSNTIDIDVPAPAGQ